MINAMNLRMTEMILKKKGYDVKKADSGQAALAFLQEEDKVYLFS